MKTELKDKYEVQVEYDISEVHYQPANAAVDYQVFDNAHSRHSQAEPSDGQAEYHNQHDIEYGDDRAQVVPLERIRALDMEEVFYFGECLFHSGVPPLCLYYIISARGCQEFFATFFIFYLLSRSSTRSTTNLAPPLGGIVCGNLPS